MTPPPPPPYDCLGRYSCGRFKKSLDKLVLPRQHATSGRLRTCSVLTTASDTTEIDEIVIVGMVKPHRLFKIIVGSKAIGDNLCCVREVIALVSSSGSPWTRLFLLQLQAFPFSGYKAYWCRWMLQGLSVCRPTWQQLCCLYIPDLLPRMRIWSMKLYPHYCMHCQACHVHAQRTHDTTAINSLNGALFQYKPSRPKGFLNLKSA